ncbi:MAG: hypothetical protein KDF65_08340, partial [Anaerolineae bacterium]|nr:hypothetical protein [Anaerolineae bacterium]
FFFEPSPENYAQHKIDWCRIDRGAVPSSTFSDRLLIHQQLGTFFLGFACHCSPFDEVTVRQAIAQSIDQKNLVKDVSSGIQIAATGGVVPPSMPGHSPEIGFSFNPNMARHLLNQSNFLKGSKIPSLTFAALPGTASSHYLVKSWQEHLGLEINLIENMPIDEIVAKLSEGSVQLALIAWDCEYPDPDSILRLLFHSQSSMNYFGWKNEQFDQLVERAATLTNQEERLALYHKADRILVAEAAAIVPLFYYQAYGLMRSEFNIDGVEKIIRGGSFKLKNVLMRVDA